ncbi:MAG: RNA polymerase factor sigma-32 [Bdellovibrionota bacterium]
MAKKVASKMTKKRTAKSVVAEIVDTDDSQEQSLALPEAEKAYVAENKLDENFAEDSIKALVPQTHREITSTDPLTTYLNELRKYPVLTKEQEFEIARKYHDTKDPQSAEILVRSNLRFVVKVAAEYSKFGAKMIDLIQEGNVGLMHAVREFNPYKGARVITYAVWWIRGYIQEYLMRQYSMVRIGTTQNQRKLFYQLQKEKEILESVGRRDSLALISSRLGIPEDEVQSMAQRLSGRDISLDRPMDDDSKGSLLDLQKSDSSENLEDQLVKQEQLQILKEKIEEIRPELSAREKIILDERILNDEPLTLQEIGEKHGITREAVRQMESRVMKKIRDRMDVS